MSLLDSLQQQLGGTAVPPGVMGMLGRFLDRDGNGSVMDDIGGMLGKLRG